MRTSEQIGKIAEALAQAQGALTTVGKSKEVSVRTKAGGSYKFTYADLAAVTEAARKPLADNGLSYVQMPGNNQDGSIALTTRLMHTSGEWIEETLSMKPGSNDPKDIGGAITYLRRYALAAMLGIVSEDEDADVANMQTGGMGYRDEQAEPQVAKWRTDAIALNASLDACETVEDLRAVMEGAESTGVMAEIGKHSPKTRDKLNEQFDRLNAALPAAETE